MYERACVCVCTCVCKRVLHQVYLLVLSLSVRRYIDIIAADTQYSRGRPKTTMEALRWSTAKSLDPLIQKRCSNPLDESKPRRIRVGVSLMFEWSTCMYKCARRTCARLYAYIRVRPYVCARACVCVYWTQRHRTSNFFRSNVCVYAHIRVSAFVPD